VCTRQLHVHVGASRHVSARIFRYGGSVDARAAKGASTRAGKWTLAHVFRSNGGVRGASRRAASFGRKSENRMRSFLITALVACAGCTTHAPALTAVDIVPFSAAGETEGLVVAYHPWPGIRVDVDAAKGVEVASGLEGARFSCLNANCSASSSGVRVEPKAISGLPFLEVAVERAGYERVVLRVPTTGLRSPTMLVVMRRSTP